MRSWTSLGDRTLIAFTSDHGEEFHEHGQMWHGRTADGHQANVPLFFYGPNHVPSGVTVSETVQNIDVMPTLMELNHLPRPEFLQGQSLVPLIAAARENSSSASREQLVEAATGGGWERRPAFTFHSLGGWKPSPLGEAFRGLAVRFRGEHISQVIAHSLFAALSFRVHHEVPQAGAAG